MGSYKYNQELWRKQHSDVMHFLLRGVSPDLYAPQKSLVALSLTWLYKVHRLGYKAKQSYAI